MKKYMAVFLDRDGNLTFSADRWEFYVLDSEKKWYTRIGHLNQGWQVSQLEILNLFQHSSFVFMQDLQRLKKKTKVIDFEKRWGSKVKENYGYSCPKCGYHFSSPPGICDDYYGTVSSDIKIKMQCICGCSFVASHEFEVVCKTTVTE